MAFVESIASQIPGVVKVMLTVFLCNARALLFYKDLGYQKDEFSPKPKRLRNGSKIEADYMIMSKSIPVIGELSQPSTVNGTSE